MFNLCPRCFVYRADKLIEGDVAICPACGDRRPFLRLPLALITGASGAGKSTVLQQLLARDTGWVLLDADVLWRSELEEDFFEIWLRMAKSINQSGRPVALFGAGTGVPENMETRVERRYFKTTHYLALTVTDDALEDRLVKRSHGEVEHAYLEEHLSFNRWFRREGPQQTPQIHVLDTTEMSPQETTEEVEAWLLQIKV
jgi:adenylate kinase family enzyme